MHAPVCPVHRCHARMLRPTRVTLHIRPLAAARLAQQHPANVSAPVLRAWAFPANGRAAKTCPAQTDCLPRSEATNSALSIQPAVHVLRQLPLTVRSAPRHWWTPTAMTASDIPDHSPTWSRHAATTVSRYPTRNWHY